MFWNHFKPQRKIKTQSTSEGCVADDETGILYFAQEDEHSGVYFINADPNTKNNDIGKIDLISKKGGFINGDTEGLAILRYEENKLLFASSQSSDDFTVYDLNNKNKFIGRVSVGKKNEIDGISKTPVTVSIWQEKLYFSISSFASSTKLSKMSW